MKNEELLSHVDDAKAKIESILKGEIPLSDAGDTIRNLNQLLTAIESLIRLTDLAKVSRPANTALKEPGPTKNRLVKVRPVDPELDGNTYLGFYIGDIAQSIAIYIDVENTLHNKFDRFNPAIFVPELNQIVFGYECWWSTINSVENFSDITDQDIEDTWYVKLFRELNTDKD